MDPLGAAAAASSAPPRPGRRSASPSRRRPARAARPGRPRCRRRAAARGSRSWRQPRRPRPPAPRLTGCADRRGLRSPSEAPVEPGDRLARGRSSVDPGLRLPAEDEQRDLARQPAHHHGLRAPSLSTARDPVVAFSIVTPTGCAAGQRPCRRCGPSPTAASRSSSPRSRGRPVRLRAADVLVVHEVLQRVQQSRRASARRTATTAADRARSLSTSTAKSRAADPPRLEVGQPRQRRQHDAGRGGAALADQQVHHEVLDGPLAAQGRLVLADLEGGVAQGGALGLRHPCHADPRGVASMRPTRRLGPVTARERGTLRDGFARPRRRDPARAVDLHPLHAGQRAVRRADRRRRLGARLVHRPRRAAGLRDRRHPAGRAARRSSRCSSAVAILRAVGIVARRLGAGVMQYRMQAHYRRDVTRQYLRLPMSWHQQHPTGQLLSNANSDVEAAWAPIAPLPMAVGTVAMMVIAVAQMLFTDLVLALVGLLVFPLVIAANVRLPAAPVAADDPRPGAARRAQRGRARVLRRRAGGQDARPRDRGDRALRRTRRTSCATTNIRAGRIRAAFDPVLEALPNLGVLAVLAVGVVRVRAGPDRPRRRGHGRLPADDRGLPDPLARLAARRVPAQRGRLRPGAGRARRDRRDGVRRPRGRRRAGAGRPARRARPGLPLRRRPGAARRPRLHRRARPHRRRRRRDRVAARAR